MNYFVCFFLQDRHNDQLASDLDNSEKKASDQPKKIVHYRRSALREEYCVRSWQKSWKRTRDKPLTKQEAMEEFAKHVGKL